MHTTQQVVIGEAYEWYPDICTWLTNIEEIDPGTIAEILNKCRIDMDARYYFIRRANEVPRGIADDDRVICRECRNLDNRMCGAWSRLRVQKV